jgi:hypothetical protein
MAERRCAMGEEAPAAPSGWPGGGLVVILVLTFVRHAVGRPAQSPSVRRWPSGQKPAPATPQGLVEPAPSGRRSRKLTFYQTLTAPLGAQRVLGWTWRPAEGPGPVQLRGASTTGRRWPAGCGAGRLDKPVGPAGAGPRVAGDERRGDWAVQAGAFRDRGQAEERDGDRRRGCCYSAVPGGRRAALQGPRWQLQDA